MFEDKTITCKDCREDFVFSASEQAFFAEKGFRNDPKRCQPCRDKKRSEVENNWTPTEVTCADCGMQTTVPFVPKQGNPVYCQSCYQKRN